MGWLERIQRKLQEWRTAEPAAKAEPAPFVLDSIGLDYGDPSLSLRPETQDTSANSFAFPTTYIVRYETVPQKEARERWESYERDRKRRRNVSDNLPTVIPPYLAFHDPGFIDSGYGRSDGESSGGGDSGGGDCA